MKNLRLLFHILFSILFIENSSAQYITIDVGTINSFCAGTTKDIRIYASGFSTTTPRFAIILSNPQGQFIAPDTIAKGTIMQQNVYQTISVSIPANAVYSTSYKVKAANVSSSEPYVSVNTSTNNLTANLSGSFQVSACSPVMALPITYTGQESIVVEIKDSLRNQILSTRVNPPPYNTFTFSHGIYRLLKVSNGCGNGVVSGIATVSIVPPTISWSTPSDTVICSGEIIKINYNISSNGCTRNLYISDASGVNYSSITPINYGSSSIFEVRIPEDLPTGENYKFKMEVIGAYGTNYQGFLESSATLSIQQSPKVTLSNNFSGTVQFYGVDKALDFTFRGLPPFNFYFDGNRYLSESKTFTINKKFYKSQTIQYGIVNDATSCMNGSLSGQYVNVATSTQINTLPANTPVSFTSRYNFKNYCKGQQMRVAYKVFGELPVNTMFKVQIRKTTNTDWIDIPSVTGYEERQLIADLPNNLGKGQYVVRVLPIDPSILVTQGTENDGSYFASNVINIIGEVTPYLGASADTVYIRKNDVVKFSANITGGAEGYPYSLTQQPLYTLKLKNSQNNILYDFQPFWNNQNQSTQIYTDTITRNTTFELVNASSLFECPNVSPIPSNKIVIIVENHINNVRISTNGLSDWYSSTNPCGGSQIDIPIWLSGNFNSNNQVKVMMARYNSPNLLFEVPSIDNGNNTRKITLPISDKPESFYLKAIASSPYTLGKLNQNSIFIQPPAKIKLSGELSVVAGSVIEIPAQVNAINNGYSITITDGINDYPFSIGFTSTPYTYILKLKIPANTPPSDLTFKVKNFTTSCGNAIIEGQTLVHVLSSPLITISNPTGVCPVNSVRNILMDFSSNLVFQANNIFKARLINRTNNQVINEYDANLVNGKIAFSYPANGLTPPNYDVQILSTAPQAVSNIYTITESNSPYLNFTVPLTIQKGGLLSLNYTLSGTPPFRLKVLEGDNISEYYTTTNTTGKGIVVDRTMTFQVLEIKDANCTFSVINDATYAAVYLRKTEVFERLYPLEISTLNKVSFCENEQIIANISKNKTYTSYQFQLAPYGTSMFFDLPTIVQDEQLVATFLPNLSKQTSFQLRVKGVLADGSIEYSSVYQYAIKLNNSSTAILTGGGNYIKDSDFGVDLVFKFTGSAPWNLTYTDGTNYYSFATSDSIKVIKRYDSESKQFSIVSVRNGCGNGTFSGQAYINVLNIQTQRLVGLEGICYGQTLIIPFSQSGTFDASNQFKIQLYRDVPNASNIANNYFTLDATWSGNALYTTIPTSLPFEPQKNSPYYIRVISTHPKVLGTYALNLSNTEKQAVFVWGNTPTISLTGGNTILAGQTSKLVAKVNGFSDFWYFRISDGATNYYYYPQSFPFEVSFSPTQTTNYTITQFYSACGGEIGSPSSQIIKIGTCVPVEIVNSPFINTNESKFAGVRVEANNEIKMGSNINYNAGSNILLLPGFSVDSGSTFKALIKGCSN